MYALRLYYYCAQYLHISSSAVLVLFTVCVRLVVCTDVVGLCMRLYSCCTVCRHPMLYFTLLYRSMCTYDCNCATRWILQHQMRMNNQCAMFFFAILWQQKCKVLPPGIYDSPTTSVHTVNSTNTAEEMSCCSCRRSALYILFLHHISCCTVRVVCSSS